VRKLEEIINAKKLVAVKWDEKVKSIKSVLTSKELSEDMGRVMYGEKFSSPASKLGKIDADRVIAEYCKMCSENETDNYRVFRDVLSRVLTC
jgi:hypothetical protein